MVGGCVRDLLSGKKGKDWDIVTDAEPEQIQEIFNNFKTLLIGKSFQTVTLIINSKVYHISSLHKEKKQKIIVQHDACQEERISLLLQDLLNRDFTINSLAWNPQKGLLDPAQGIKDLKQRVIRSREPNLRFQEDPLRMLRAIRIACELNFAIDKKTKDSIYNNAFLLHRVSSERIREEISSILKSSEAQRGIELLRHCGLERHILSKDGVKKELLDNSSSEKISFYGLDEFKEDLSTLLALWGRLYFGSCYRTRIFFLPLISSLRFKNIILKKLAILLSREWTSLDFNTTQNIRFLMAEVGRENCKTMFRLKKTLLSTEGDSNRLNKRALTLEEKLVQDELEKNPPVSLTDLAVKGKDLIKIGLPPGKRMGEILQLLLNKVLVSPENNYKDYLLSIAAKIKDKDLE